MDMEDVGNNEPVGTTGSAISIDAEMAELDREFAEAAEEFGLDETIGSSEFAELDAALEGTELALDDTETADPRSIALAIADGWQPGSGGSQAEFGFIGNIIKNKAKKLIKKLVAFVRKSRKYAVCIPAVTKAVAAFKAGKWGTALKAAYAAYRCIKSK